MRLFQRRSSTLIDSELHNEHSFFGAFIKDFKVAKHEVMTESPFMTKRRANELALLCLRIIQKGLVVSIYTRNPFDDDNRLKEQVLMAMDILKSAGVCRFSCYYKPILQPDTFYDLFEYIQLAFTDESIFYKKILK